jgi:hypothetical protein
MEALAKTKVLPYFSAQHLLTELRATDCVSCGTFGTFLYMPTCRRACRFCLSHNPSLHTITISQARRFFKLRTRDFRRAGIPIVHRTYERRPSDADTPAAIDKPSGAEDHDSLPPPLLLVGSKCVKDLAVAVHGSILDVMLCVARAGLDDSYEQSLALTVVRAPDLPLRKKGELTVFPMVRHPDIYSGLAQIRFPRLSKAHRRDYGVWCEYCQERHASEP